MIKTFEETIIIVELHPKDDDYDYYKSTYPDNPEYWAGSQEFRLNSIRDIERTDDNKTLIWIGSSVSPIEILDDYDELYALLFEKSEIFRKRLTE